MTPMTNIFTKTEAIAAKNPPKPQWGVVNNCKSIIYSDLNKTKTKNSRLKTLLLAVLFALLAPLAARAQSTFGGGSGTSYDPYLIYNTDHFDQLAAEVNNGNSYNKDVYFKLMEDLDYTNKTFTPVGGAYYSYYDPDTQLWRSSYREFCGTFWGNGHSINNVTINTNAGDYFGLFGCLGLGGSVGQLTLGGQSTMTTIGQTGGIVGVVRGNLSNSSIFNVYDCHVGENVVISVHPDAAGSSYDPLGFGGVAGGSNGVIKNCTSKATISNNGIAKTNKMGGIVGAIFNGEVRNCYFMGSVIGINKVGDIIGEKTGGNINNNYYHASPRNGGVNGNDTDGAQWMGTVSFGEHVSGVLASATYWDGATPYFGAGKAMLMAMNYSFEAGYVPVNEEYFANGNIPLTLDNYGYHQFTMPDADVTITGNATLKRDIGYSNWVSIDIPSQTYTGNPLTPLVTVTDNKSGSPVVLVENTDFTVTLPDGGCIGLGQHTITIMGIGNFGGQTTATFTIGLPGGGSGTVEDPYNILTTDDMDVLAASVNGGDNKYGKHFCLLADLDYSGKTYTPIGTMSSRFQGTFDGHGHSIKNVVINQPSQDYQALFAVIHSNGTVKNLVLGEGSAITGGYYVGGIAGLCSGTITGCSVSEGVSITGNEEVGGIAGRMVGTLSGCVNKASVSGSTRVGGIAGGCFSSTLSNNLNFCAVGGNATYKGGIVGYVFGSTLSNNYYAGNYTVGGIGGNDVAGQAMRGYTIEAYAPLSISLEGSIGLPYEGKVYAGNGQDVLMRLNSSLTPQCYILSAGTLVDNGNDTYTITMPNHDITIKGNIVEFYGTYYEIPCDGSTTATVIYDISYATLDYADIEDFEYGGVQYTVTAIADGAFDGFDNLTGINCHSNISSIGDHAFRNCTGIMSFGLYQADTPPTLGEGVFDGLGIDTLWLMVPFCSQYDYGQHAVFGQFGTIIGNGMCEYNFFNSDGDKQWSNPANWQDAYLETCTEAPGAGARVAIFEDCEIGEDITVGSVTIGNYYVEEYDLYERLTVKDGATLTATDFIYTTGDARNFVIEDGAQVDHPNAGAQATVEKNIAAHTATGGWHFIASPLVGSITPTADNGFLANEYDLYFYDEPTHYWRNHKQGTNNANPNFDIEPLKGYLYANSANDTLQLQGILRTATETVNFPLSYASADGILIGFNLVGNPFAHNVTDFTGTNVAEEVYQLNDLRNEVIAGLISTDNPLKPGEGFFVKAMGDNASITFNDNGAKGFGRSLSLSKGRIALEISQDNLLIDRLILKRDGAPLEKFTLNENSTKVYATEDAQDWAVVVIASEAKQSSPTGQAVNFKAVKDGEYTLRVNMEGLDLDYLHLIDNLTGADVDLLPLCKEGQGDSTSATYTFQAKTTDYASRFKLVFSTNDASTGSASDAPFAYISDGNIIVNGKGTLQVIDMMGRVIVSHNGHTRCVSTAGMTAGVYVLRLIDGDSVRTQKIVVE